MVPRWWVSCRGVSLVVLSFACSLDRVEFVLHPNPILAGDMGGDQGP